jgi:drug/metabolite transporter (DMT)-like permease
VPKPESSRHHAVVALLVLAAIWGYNWVQMKIAVQYASPFMVAALRITLGSLSLLLVMVALRKPLKPQAIPETCLLGLLQTAGVYTFATWALVSGGAGKTAVLVYTMPFWTVILAWILLKERVRGWQWVAIALSFAGLLLILDPSSLTGTILSKVLALLAGICWAGGAIVAKQLQQKITIDLLSLTTWQGVFAAIPLVVIAAITPPQPIIWSPAFIGALLYNVIPGTAIAMLLWLYILNHLSAGSAGLGTLINPVIGVLTAWAQLGERPTWTETMGIVLIITALAVNSGQVPRYVDSDR